MPNGVSRGLEDLELRPGEGEGAVPIWDEHVRRMDQSGGVLLHHVRGEEQKIALQAQQAGAHPSLPGGEGHGDVVFLLKIAVVPPVVHMSVGAQDTRRSEAVVQQGLLQLLPLLSQSGVQQDAAAAVQPVEGDKLQPLL